MIRVLFVPAQIFEATGTGRGYAPHPPDSWFLSICLSIYLYLSISIDLSIYIYILRRFSLGRFEAAFGSSSSEAVPLQGAAGWVHVAASVSPGKTVEATYKVDMSTLQS